MTAPRNDTLSAKVIHTSFLMDCDPSTYICFEWQIHQIISSTILIIFFGLLTTTVTYQLCFSKTSQTKQLNRSIKCISLCYFYCMFISVIFLLTIALYFVQPFTEFGWEYNDNGGWIYDSNIAGYTWEYADKDWEWNQSGSWQWTAEGGWYYLGEWEWDPIKWFILFLCFVVLYFAQAIGICASYLYPFRRLYNSFLPSQYALSKNEINLHYFNAVLIFILSLVSSFANFTGQHVTVNRIMIAINIFYGLGFGYMMYQFNTRLLNIIVNQQNELSKSDSKQMNTEMETENIQKSAIQIQLINVVVKHSLLSLLQLVTFGLCAITSVIFQITTHENEWVFGTAIGEAHIMTLWLGAIQSICISTCIFFGFSANAIIYDKLCNLCHKQVNKICQKISTKQILRKEFELSAVCSDSNSDVKGVPTNNLANKEKSVTSFKE
eukprot:79953_1